MRKRFLLLLLLAAPCLTPGSSTAGSTEPLGEAFVYAASLNTGSVVVVDPRTLEFVTKIRVDSTPVAIAASPTTTRAYVACQNLGTVAVLDTVTHEVITKFPTGSMLRDIAVAPDGKRVYAASLDTPTVFEIDASTNAITANIPVPSRPEIIEIRPDGKEAWVGSTGTLRLLDLGTNTITGWRPGGLSLHFSRDSKTAYIGTLAKQLLILDVPTGAILATIPLAGFPQAIQTPRAGDRLFIAQTLPNEFLTVDLTRNEVVSAIPIAGNPLGIGLAENDSLAFLSSINSSAMAVIDLSDLTPLASIPMPDSRFSLWDIAVTFEPKESAPPEIDCRAGAIVANDPGRCSATIPCGAIASCHDSDGYALGLSCGPAEIPVGVGDVTVVCTDGLATATKSCPVTVVDVDPPEVSVHPDPAVLWPPNHFLVDVTASVEATDNCGTSDVRLVSISSSDLENATGDGDTAPDVAGAVIGTSDFLFSLRAERSSGKVRVYTIVYGATDAAGNTGGGSGRVEVRPQPGMGAEP